MDLIIHFLNGNDLSIQNHYNQKGYRDDIIVEIDRRYYEVYFYIEGNIRYEMKHDFFSFPGLIVLDDITIEKIYSSLNQLIDLKYFDYFKGNDLFPLNRRFQDTWYSNGLEIRQSYKTCSHKLR